MSPEEISWLVAKSSQTGKAVDVIAIELIRAAAKKDGFLKSNKPEPKEGDK